MKENRTLVTLAVVLATFAPAVAAQVEVSVDVTGMTKPGGMVTATATVDIMDGSTVESYAWTQTGGVPVLSMTGADTAAATVKLGLAWQCRPYLIHIISEPPIGPGELPENVPFPEGEFHAGLQDRWQVVGLNPFSIEEAGLVTLGVAVTTTTGTYHGEAEIHTQLPWKPTSGLRKVPVGIPVLLQGKAQASYDWELDPQSGSSVNLDGAASRNPTFTPDGPGIYEVAVTDLATTDTVTLDVYAGTWLGVIEGQDENGKPIGNQICTTCHVDGGIAEAIFPDWSQTGHASAFSNGLNALPLLGHPVLRLSHRRLQPRGGERRPRRGLGLPGLPRRRPARQSQPRQLDHDARGVPEQRADGQHPMRELPRTAALQCPCPRQGGRGAAGQPLGRRLRHLPW